MKRYLMVAAIFFMAILAAGCNKQILDTTYRFDEAMIEMPNGDIVSGEVQSWTDFGDGDQLQIKIDGDMYLVHSSDVVMIKHLRQDNG